MIENPRGGGGVFQERGGGGEAGRVSAGNLGVGGLNIFFFGAETPTKEDFGPDIPRMSWGHLGGRP